MKKYLYTFASEYKIIQADSVKEADEIIKSIEGALSWAWIYEGELIS